MMVLIAGCADEPTHFVYVDSDPCGFHSVDGDDIYNLWVFPKDKVAWVNTSAKELTITFDSQPPNLVFDVTEVVIKPNHRVTLTVNADATGSADYDIKECRIEPDAILGLPKVIVGEGP
jgi:hypothetical protein